MHRRVRGARLNGRIFADSAKRAEQGCAQLTLQLVLALKRRPSQARRRRTDDIAHRGSHRRPLRIACDHVQVAEGADQRAPYIDVGLVAEQSGAILTNSANGVMPATVAAQVSLTRPKRSIGFSACDYWSTPRAIRASSGRERSRVRPR